jgi:eukaryotic-like serine/threonine-protein kinase
LGGPDIHLLGVSAQGELAVSLRPMFFGPFSEGGTLALMPSIGGVPRQVAENIVYADWSPTGELAVVRFVDGKRQLEFPLGQKLFETAGVISTPRISPAGDRVAFVEYSLAAPHQLLVADRKGAVQRLDATGYIDGLAWAPGGQEVWFTAWNSIWASPLSGGRRLVYQGLSPMRLDDISADGKVLVTSLT